METRWVLHVDLDQFIAAVEVLRRPELRGRPVIVGGRGDPTERGVVSTASYEAREYGVGSGMPLRLAARKCPDAVFLPVDAPAYEAASAVVMDTLRSLEWGGRPVVVEVLGWDEAFVAADRSPVEGVGGGPPQAAPEGGLDDLGDPREFAQRIRAAVLEAAQLHCSVGIGNNKLQAKIATDFGKPAVQLRTGGSAPSRSPSGRQADPAARSERQGIYVITDETWFAEMGHRPTRSLWGIGSKTAKKLEALGIHTVEQLATSDARVLAAELGPTMGPWFHRLGRGVDTSPVDATPWVPRAHGREETFQEDLTDWGEVEAAIRRITRRVVADIDREGRPAFRVGLKIRFRPFDTLTRVHKIDEPTNDPEVLADEAVALLDRVEKRRPVRLLGVRLEMVPPEGGY